MSRFSHSNKLQMFIKRLSRKHCLKVGICRNLSHRRCGFLELDGLGVLIERGSME